MRRERDYSKFSSPLCPGSTFAVCWITHRRDIRSLPASKCSANDDATRKVSSTHRVHSSSILNKMCRESTKEVHGQIQANNQPTPAFSIG